MKTNSVRPMYVLVVMAALVALGAKAKADLITNGGFETGDFTGWTVDANSYPEYIVTSPVHSGNNAAQIAGYSYDPDTIAQTIATVPGQTYELSFWRDQTLSGPTISLVVTWDGTTVFSELNPPGFGSTGYQEFTAFVSGKGSDTLTFIDANDPGYTYLDDVSLDPFNFVPEPASLSLLGLGAAALLASRRRRAV